jgi:hypothetical protein
MDACPDLSVLFCHVDAEALQLADPPSKKTFQISKLIQNVRKQFRSRTGRKT